MSDRRMIALLTVATLAWGAPAAAAATLSVDDDAADCPAAGYTSVQAAVEAAQAGDTVAICPGDYAEGSGAPSTNALTVTKSLTIRGAGADLVRLTPRATTPTGGSIAQPDPDLRSGTGDIVAVVGTPRVPVTVDLSGVTVAGTDARGRAVASNAGVVYLDAAGSITRSRVTDVVTSEGATAYEQAGGWRGALPGWGIVQTSATRVAPGGGRRLLSIRNTRVDRYNRGGVLVDGATSDAPPLTPSGVVNAAAVSTSQIVGRVECADFEGTGDCAQVGLLTTGPLFGQDGIRVTTGARLTLSDSLVSQNLVNGAGAPGRSAWDRTLGAYRLNATNRASLPLAAGIRLLGASLRTYTGPASGQILYSSATRSNLTDNAYGVLNLAADGTTTRTGDPTSTTGGADDVFFAEDNWWGLGYYRATNPGPAISPAENPPVPENPVNGTAVTDGDGQTSDAVDVSPFRNGQQGDPFAGQVPIVDAPGPVDDAAPTVTLSAPATVRRGTSFVLTATAADDFGVRSVAFYAGATLVGSATTTPYTASVAVPAGARCGSRRTYAAVAEDALGQTTASAPVTVAIRCPGSPGGGGPGAPGAPSVTLGPLPRRLTRPVRVRFAPVTPAGFARAVVFLGDRRVCAVRSAPYACRLVPTGDDVGRQVLRVVVTDRNGASAEANRRVVVPRFAARLRTTVTRRPRRGGRVRRTLRVRIVRPAGVSARQGCRGGHVTLVVRRARRTLVDEQLQLRGACTLTRSVTAARRPQRFTARVTFGGNAVLRASRTTRRFK